MADLNIDKYQFVTLFFAGLVLFETISAYNGVFDAGFTNENLQAANEVLLIALPLAFAGYALTVPNTGVRGKMYKNLINVVALVSWIWTVANADVSNASLTGWDAVTYYVVRPLAAGALVAVPVANFA